VFCCDPRKKRCELFERALKLLGITEEHFVAVMEKHRVPVEEKDGSCFGSLAFCPSPEKESKDRDEALLRMGWSLTKYLKYKFEILRELVPPDKLDLAFSTRLVKQYALEILDLETRRVYKAFAVGNLETGVLTVTEIFKENSLRDRQVETALSNTAYVAARIPRDLVDKLDELVKKGVINSRSDGIRRALLFYLNAFKESVKGS